MSAAPNLKIVEPPVLDQAEQALLGSYLFYPDLLDQFPLLASDFTLLKNRWVCEAMLSLAGRKEAVSGIAVKAELESVGTLAKIGDPHYTALLENRASELSGGHSMRETAGTLYLYVKECAKQRRGIELHTMAANTLKNGKYDEHARIVAQIAELAQPKKANNPAIKLLSYDDLKDMPPVSYLDTGHELVKGGFNVLYARRGAGKSTMALHYALTIGQDSPAVYVMGEGVGGSPDRIAAWMNHHKKGAGQFHLINRAIRMLDDTDVSALIAATPPGTALIVLDTLARCMVGGNENDTKDMVLFVEACDRLRRETGAAVLVLHHTGKAANGTRGSIVLEDAADMVIRLVNDEGALTLSCDKARDSEPFPARGLQMITTNARPDNTAQVVVPSDRVVQTDGDKLTGQNAQILETLNLEIYAGIGTTYTRLQHATEIPEASLSRRLSELKERGYIRQSDRGEPYYITDKGKQKLRERSERSENALETTMSEQSSHSHTYKGVSVGVGGGNSNGKPEFGVTLTDQKEQKAFEKMRAKDAKK